MDNPNENKMELEYSPDEFMDFLILKELAFESMVQYITHFKLFRNEQGLLNPLQERVNSYLLNHKGYVAKAFIKNYLAFIKDKEVAIPQTTGRKPQKIITPPTPAEVQRVIDALYVRGEMWGLMGEISVQGALRMSEVIGLTPNSFDWDNWGSNTSKPCRVKVLGKGSMERWIIITPALAVKFKNYLQKLIDTQAIDFMNGFIFKVRGDKLSKSTWWKVLSKVSMETIGKHIHPHKLRHFTATELWKSGNFEMLDIKNYLGHKSLNTTERYIHSDKEETLKKIEKLINK